MAVYVTVALAPNVTQDEWIPVYEESLAMAEAFGLADIGTVVYSNLERRCLVPTRERRSSDGSIGWNTCGDLFSLECGRTQYLPRNLGGYGDAGYVDPIVSTLAGCGEVSLADVDGCGFHFIFGESTNGRPYHLALLAISAMIETRLGEKALVYGDINRGQCRRAVALANQICKTPVELPVCCDMERLFARIQELNLSELVRARAFHDLYLGRKDKTFYDFVNHHYSPSAIRDYWREGLIYDEDIRCHRDTIKEFFDSGGSIETLCSLVAFDSVDIDTSTELYRCFILDVLSTRVYREDKDLRDLLNIDPEGEGLYSDNASRAIDLMAKYQNYNTCAYIPLSVVRKVLTSTVPVDVSVDSTVPVDVIIDEFLKEDALSLQTRTEPSLQLNDQLEERKTIFQKDMNNDIYGYSQLVHYRSGQTIAPKMLESMTQFLQFYFQTCEHDVDTVQELLQEGPDACCRYLVANLEYLLPVDQWEVILNRIHQDAGHMRRYYPACRVMTRPQDSYWVVLALLLNDDFYMFARDMPIE